MAFDLSRVTDTWDEFAWPSWVPLEIRTQIQDFWAERYGRSPRTWAENAQDRKCPLFLERCVALLTADDQPVEGGYVHAWNNIGRLIDGRGQWHVVYDARAPNEEAPSKRS